MVLLKYIEMKLKFNNIYKYKIVKSIEKQFSYKLLFGEISYDEVITEKIYVLFKHDDGVTSFIITNVDSDLDLIIKSCIENVEPSDHWHENCIGINNIFTNNISNKNDYDDFNSEQILSWIQKQSKEIKKNINFNFNTIFNLYICKQLFLSNVGYSEQYTKTSSYILLENKHYKKIVNITDCSIGDNITNNLLKKLNFDELSLKSLNIKGNILFKAEAFASILDNMIKCFYADMIYNGLSIIKINDIGKKLFKSKFNLIASPFENILFDSEGTIISEKIIIKDGKFVDLLCNNAYSCYLGLKSYGNANLNDFNNISHQRLKFIPSKVSNKHAESVNIIINSIKILQFDIELGTINGIINYSDTIDNIYLYRSPICLNVESILNNIFFIGSKNKWINNILCPDVVIKI